MLILNWLHLWWKQKPTLIFQANNSVVWYFQKACHISWKLAWCDTPTAIPRVQAGPGHRAGVATETDSSLNLLISCSIRICKSSYYSKDVAKAAGKWYWRISSTNSMEDWPWNTLWDIGIYSYFHFPMLSGTSPVMHMRTLRHVVLLVSLLIVFLAILTLLFSHSAFSPSFPQLTFLF